MLEDKCWMVYSVLMALRLLSFWAFRDEIPWYLFLPALKSVSQRPFSPGVIQVNQYGFDMLRLRYCKQLNSIDNTASLVKCLLSVQLRITKLKWGHHTN